MSEKTSLKKDQLGFLEVIALSVAILAPTFASSMNFGMIASNAGYSVSLVFIISVIAGLLSPWMARMAAVRICMDTPRRM